MSATMQVFKIPLSKIEVSHFNVRRSDKDTEIQQLAESIKSHGLLQPVVLRGTYGTPPYELLIGQRRLLAHRKLKRKKIDAVFCGAVKDIEAIILSLSENIQRVELNHADKAEAITALYKHFGKRIRRVAAELDLSEQTIRDYIKIKELATPKATALLRQRKISKEDLKRVIRAAQGDKRKINALLKRLPKMPKFAQERAATFGKSHPRASTEEIVKEGKIAKAQPVIILSISKDVDLALSKAESALSVGRREIAQEALDDWLRKNGFLKN